MNKAEIKVPANELDRPFKDYEAKVDFELKESQKKVHFDLNISREGYHFPIKDINGQLSENINLENNEVKPPLTTDELIEKLQDNIHHILFSDEELECAREDLRVISYYRISAFRKDIDAITPTYSDLIGLYKFDRYLRESLSRLIPAVEVYLKTTLARFLSVNYDSYAEDTEKIPAGLAYLNENIYNPKKRKDIPLMLSYFAEGLTKKIKNDRMIKHHVIKYGGDIPIWVLFEELTLGQFSMLVSKLKPQIVKDWVAESFSSIHYYKYIYEWIMAIQFLRNTTAHSAKIYGQKFPYNPLLQDEDAALISEVATKQDVFNMLQHTFFIGLGTV
ncbi:Abi family protein [Levilactobacillus tujiorum]|uniref:Abi family protein n=1 Tax=Levilactobacillus tujiorum TaxID=2912243 RepID=UPI00145775A0|nr:Abi family protein [Levilactobacillus tujiorum]NLR32799.1 Abi family protein [Levilactobacillus tujiorum]